MLFAEGSDPVPEIGNVIVEPDTAELETPLVVPDNGGTTIVADTDETRALLAVPKVGAVRVEFVPARELLAVTITVDTATELDPTDRVEVGTEPPPLLPSPGPEYPGGYIPVVFAEGKDPVPEADVVIVATTVIVTVSVPEVTRLEAVTKWKSVPLKVLVCCLMSAMKTQDN